MKGGRNVSRLVMGYLGSLFLYAMVYVLLQVYVIHPITSPMIDKIAAICKYIVVKSLLPYQTRISREPWLRK